MKKILFLNIFVLIIVVASFSFLYFLHKYDKIFLESKVSLLAEEVIEKNKILEKQQVDFSIQVNDYVNQTEEKYNQLLSVLESQDKSFSVKMAEIKKEQSDLASFNLQNDFVFAENLKEMGNQLIISQERKQKLVEKWSKIVTRLTCKTETDQNTGGSGVYFDSSIFGKVDGFNGNIILTNEHVLREDDEYINYCEVDFLNEKNSKKLEEDGEEKIYTIISEELDIAYLDFGENNNSLVEDLQDEEFNICDFKLQKGDEILILGYPSIGSSEDITITLGIISGYDDEFYMTDAKIAKGNSGGAAISIKHDCYFGIPTLVMKGKLEVMGRVLDVNNIISL